MSNLRSRAILVLLRAYVAIALAVAAVFSPPALSLVPILLIIWYLFLWRWPLSSLIRLLTDYFLFFAIAILLAPTIGPFLALLVSLPVLALIGFNLKVAAVSLSYRDTKYVRSPTRIGIALPTMAILGLGVSLLLGSASLLLACVTALSYFGIFGVVVIRRLPLKPVEETQIRQRMVAGTEDHLEIKLTTKAEIGGLLFVESPYQWLKISPDKLSLRRKGSS